MSKSKAAASDKQNPLVKLEADLKEALSLIGSDDRKAAGFAVRATLEFVYAHPHLKSQGLTRPLYPRSCLAVSAPNPRDTETLFAKPRRRRDNGRDDGPESLGPPCFCTRHPPRRCARQGAYTHCQ